MQKTQAVTSENLHYKLEITQSHQKHWETMEAEAKAEVRKYNSLLLPIIKEQSTRSGKTRYRYNEAIKDLSRLVRCYKKTADIYKARAENFKRESESIRRKIENGFI